MSVQLKGEVTVIVTQCNYCISEDHGGPHHVHQLQFPVLEEGEEDYVDIESFSASTLIRYVQWEDYRLEDELWREQCRREGEDETLDS